MLFSRSVRAGALAFVFCSLPALAHAETMREAMTSAYRHLYDELLGRAPGMSVHFAADGG